MVKDVEMRDGSAGSCGKSKEIVEAQRTYYMEGKTRALSARIDALNRLEQSILTYEQEHLPGITIRSWKIKSRILYV